MRVSTAPRKRNSPRLAEKDAPGFLQWLRGRECLFKDMAIPCGGKPEAMHVDYAGDKGMGTKVSDRFCVPGCTAHHALQHRLGWDSFETEIRIARGATLIFAKGYWDRWPSRIAWERKLADG